MRGEVLTKGAVAFGSGIASAAFLPGEAPFLLAIGGLVFGALFLFFSIRVPALWLLGLCLILFSSGVWWHARADLAASAQELAGMASLQAEQVLEGIIAGEPEDGERTRRFLVQPDRYEGGILVFAEPFARGSFGDRVVLSGVLKEPPSFPDFDYPEYLKGKGIYGVMERPSIEIREIAGFSGSGFLIEFRQAGRSKIRQHLPAPASDLASAILLGYKSDLSQEMREQLNRTGLRHLTAISGMHVAILAGMLFWAFQRRGIRGWGAFAAVSLGLAAFVALSGMQVSAIRAAAMGSMLLFAGTVGRTYDASRALLLVAVLFLVGNPLIIRDAGFQLSFGAVLGIIWFSPVFRSWMGGRSV